MARPDAGGWRWRWLIGSQVAAWLLLGSWFYPATRVVWESVDHVVFGALNASHGALGTGWHLIWAISNNRGVDLLMAAFFIGLYFHFMLSTDRRLTPRGLARGCLIALHAFFMLELSREVFTFDRFSPTMAMDDAIRLSTLVPWAHPKDASGAAFPAIMLSPC